MFSLSVGGSGDRHSLVLHLRGGARGPVRHPGGEESRHGGHREAGGDQLEHGGGGAAGRDTVPTAAATHGARTDQPAARTASASARTTARGENFETYFYKNQKYFFHCQRKLLFK